MNYAHIITFLMNSFPLFKAMRKITDKIFSFFLDNNGRLFLCHKYKKKDMKMILIKQ